MLMILAANLWTVIAPPETKPVPPSIESLVADLASDDVRWNAYRAMGSLMTAAAIPALERALDSDDWQQRQLAAACLRRIESYRPSDQMLRVLVEGLADDARVKNGVAGTTVYNADDGSKYLVPHARAVMHELIVGMNSGDLQMRFMSAVVLAFGGVEETIPLAAPILIEHLRDNDIGVDAMMACAALYRFGPAVRAVAERALECTVDEQQDLLLRRVLQDLDEDEGRDVRFAQVVGGVWGFPDTPRWTAEPACPWYMNDRQRRSR